MEHFRQSVRVAVDGMAMDLLHSMRFAFGNDSGTALGQVAVYGVMECDGGADGVYSYDCPLSSQKLTVLDARGLVDSAGRPSFIDLGSSSVEHPSIHISYGNYLKILAFAHLVDLGVWEGDPFFSPELFNRTTDPNGEFWSYRRGPPLTPTLHISQMTFRPSTRASTPTSAPPSTTPRLKSSSVCRVTVSSAGSSRGRPFFALPLPSSLTRLWL